MATLTRCRRARRFLGDTVTTPFLVCNVCNVLRHHPETVQRGAFSGLQDFYGYDTVHTMPGSLTNSMNTPQYRVHTPVHASRSFLPFTRSLPATTRRGTQVLALC